MKRTGSDFGAPKPLPNQAGYNANPTEHLESEAKDMEVRLQMLQLRMQQQQEDDEATPKPGGSRWGSARADKGSTTRYAKDVQEKIKKSELKRAQKASQQREKQVEQHKQQVEQHKEMQVQQQRQMQQMMSQSAPLMQAQIGATNASNANNANNANKQPAEPSPSPGASGAPLTPAFRNKDIQKWSVKDVSQWLVTIKLGQYAAQFQENEIDGPILLELSLEDFDYMSVKVLGHRKVLLKGIEDLRKNGRVTIELQAAAPPSAGSAVPVHPAVSSHLESLGQDSYGQNQAQIYAPRVLDPALQAQRDQREREEREEEERKKREVHWSKLEPLQTQQEKRGLANDVDGLHQHNPADGMIDEEAEKALFAAAVAEWRGETPKDQPVRVKIIRNGQEVQRIETGGVGGQQSLPAQSITKANADASMWTNPFGPGPTSSDLFDDDDDDDDTPNTGATGGGAKTDQSFLPPIASPSQSPAKAQGLAGAGGAASGGLRAASLQDLDEEAERRAFAKAVDEWRGTGSSQNQSSPSNRSPRSASVNNNNNNGVTAAAGTGTGSNEPITAVASDGSQGKKLAEALEAQMEKEQADAARGMEEKMEAIRAKLQRARLEQAAGENARILAGGKTDVQARLEEVKKKHAEFDMNDDSDEGEGFEGYLYESRPAPHAHTQAQAAVHSLSPGVAASVASVGGNQSKSPLKKQTQLAFGSNSNTPSQATDSLLSQMISPRGGAPPVITLVTSQPNSNSQLGVEDLEDEGAQEQYYVVEESSDED